MKNETMELQVVNACIELLEKTGVQLSIPASAAVGNDDVELESILITIKSINARYDKNEAIFQIQHLMDEYNIQLDQLIDKHGI